MRSPLLSLMRTFSSLALPAILSFAAEPKGPVTFNRDIRPIMSDTCFRCHGPDSKARIAGLRLDIREEAIKATKTGTIPIVPGNPEQSAVIARVFARDPALVMPPEYAHKELTSAQKEMLRQWITEGAKYEGHWAYEPVKRPSVPEIPDAKGPIRNPIDAFIQTRLMRENIPPSGEADRRTLIRRVALDLTGLPPTTEELEAFLKDESPDAYEKIVERLLSSSRYAEKQAMHWLDAVRYADTSGFHGDNPFPAWPYRDYVLRAFRDNKPFDQFTREQLGGDLIPDATIDQKIASAYNRMNRVSAEGGLQPKEYLAKYAADRVRTTSSVWLGATMGCAECHDHKFDPIATRDFYSMKAFFADIKETGLVPIRGANAWGTRLSIPSDEQNLRLKELDDLLQQTKAELEERAQSIAARLPEWERQILAQHESGRLAWRYQRPLSATAANGAILNVYNDQEVDANFYTTGGGGATLVSERKPGEGLIVAGGANPDNETYTIKFQPGEGVWTALGIEIFQDESLPGVRLARGADRFVLTEVNAELSLKGAKPGHPLSFALATSDGFGQPQQHPGMAAIDGNPKTGWGVMLGEGRNPFLALRFARKVRTEPGSIMTVHLRQDSDFRRATIGRFRVALSAGEHSWPELGDATAKNRAKPPEAATLAFAVERGVPGPVLEALELPAEKRSEAQQKAVLEHFKWASPDLEPLLARLGKVEAERGILGGEVPEIVVAEAGTPRETRILPRANWMDDSGDIVEPAVPAFLGKLDTAGRRPNRVDLANWIVSVENPLTPRVFVNRLWRQFFGTGLSKVLDDLGSQGEWPIHPELLDWLAAEFVQPTWKAEDTHPWDVKHVIRIIVTSHTYRQSSLTNSQLDERDPDNRLLARQSRFRVDAEIVRDIALAVSGMLVEKFGGPSTYPYQPAGYLTAMNFPKREYSASRGGDLYRRGIYTHWQRTFLHPSLLAFDAPTREECTVTRMNSNTPLQALVMLNDPIFVEAARVFAQNILKRTGGADHQIQWAFLAAVGRTPGPEERRILADLYRKSQAHFRARPAEAKELLQVGDAPLPKRISNTELAAMTAVARAILNLHETITRN